jgi:HAE1 family hydrophobic/amphiphilic exporter-1
VEFALLKPWAERGATLTASNILTAVRPKLLAIPDAVALSFDPPTIPGIATTGGFEFQVEDLTGQGAQALNDATQALLAEARKQPELNARQLFSTFSTSTPEYNYDLDRTKAKLLGLSLPDVFNTLQIELGSLYVNDFTLFGRTFRVIMQAENGARARPTNVSSLYVRNTAGGMVPLGTLGKLRPTVGPEFVSHYDLGRSGGGINRPGFERLLASICAGRVGAVFAIEASRLARNGRDWHTLIEFCGLVWTVIVDEDGIYDPRHPNDRLLLGMNGMVT